MENYQLTFEDIHSMVTEYLEVAKCYIASDETTVTEKAEALAIIKAYYKGVKLESIINMPITF